MHSLHPQARTTPAVRQEIARSTEPTGVLAQRFSVSTETIRKWRKRGAQDCQDHSSRPHKLPWKATEEERAIVCALRQATGFPLDDLTFIVTHFLPHLNRDAVYRILKAEGLGRLPPAQQRQRKSGTFKDYDLGFVHIDIKHLPKLRTANGESRKRFLYVAIDRCSRWVHLAVKDDELATSAVAFLKEAVRAFPFKITHVLTDRGSCFTADGFEEACRQLKVEHRTTKPYTPQTNGLVERFNGRVQREVLGITIYSHRDLETLLKGFNQAYNRRRQRVLKGRSPGEVVRSRLAAEPKLANRRYKPPDSDALPPALQGRRSRQGGLASRQLGFARGIHWLLCCVPTDDAEHVLGPTVERLCFLSGIRRAIVDTCDTLLGSCMTQQRLDDVRVHTRLVQTCREGSPEVVQAPRWKGAGGNPVVIRWGLCESGIPQASDGVVETLLAA